MNAYEILGVSSSATQEEIKKAYKKLSLKYHPDKNRGNEEWAKQKFIEVGEAYKTLAQSAPKRKFEFSNKLGSDKFKEFEEMLNELRGDFEDIGKGLEDIEENLNKEEERLTEDAIKNTEERFALSGVSSSDLSPSLWFPYSDWREKFRNLNGGSLTLFLSQMTVAIQEAKIKKNNGNYKNDYSSSNSQQPKRNYDKFSPNFSDRNFSPVDDNEELTISDKIKKLEEEIESNKKFLSETTSEKNKQKCLKDIGRLEKELEKLLNQHNSTHSNSNNNGSSSSNKDNSKKDEKIRQLEAEIEQLKKNDSVNPRQQQENQKKLAEKEKELTKVIKERNQDNSSTDNENYENWTHEQLVKEIKKLKAEIRKLKDNKNIDNSEKQSILTNKLEKLEKLEKVKSNVNNSDNKFPTGLVVGGGILVVIGLVVGLIIRKKRKKKII